MLRNAKRQLSLTLILGLWLSSAVSIATACTPSACRDDCDMHRVMRAHEAYASECGAHDHIATLTVRCTCGALVGHADMVPAISTATARPERSEDLSPHLAVLPDVRPHVPSFARFFPREPSYRLSRVTVPASPGLRAPPAA